MRMYTQMTCLHYHITLRTTRTWFFKISHQLHNPLVIMIIIKSRSVKTLVALRWPNVKVNQQRLRECSGLRTCCELTCSIQAVVSTPLTHISESRWPRSDSRGTVTHLQVLMFVFSQTNNDEVEQITTILCSDLCKRHFWHTQSYVM